MEEIVIEKFKGSKKITLFTDRYDKDFDSSIDFPLHKELLIKILLKFHNEDLSKAIQNNHNQNKYEIIHGEIENIIEKVKLDFLACKLVTSVMS